MKNSFTLVVILMSFLIAQVICAPPPKTESPSKKVTKPEQKKPAEVPSDESESEEEDSEEDTEEDDASDEDDDDDNQEADLMNSSDEEDNSEEETQPLSLTCTLFDEQSPCDAMCSMIGAIYGYPVTPGHCEKNLYCECSINPDATIDDIWNTKFNAKSVLKEILDDKNLSKKVMKILQKPMRTREQTLQDLQSSLSPEQLQKIKIKDTIATKLLSVDGKFDMKAIKTYVAKKLTPMHDQLEKGMYYGHLDHILLEDENEDLKQYLISEIRRTANKPLNKALNLFVKRYKVQESTSHNHDHETLVDVLDRIITNQIFSPINQRWNPKNLIKKTPIPSKTSTSGGKL